MMARTAAAGRGLEIGRLGIGSMNRRASGWWGMMTLILTEGFLFLYLLFSYYYFAIQNGRSWLPAELPSFHLSGPSTAILVLSSVTAWWAERGARNGSSIRLSMGLLVSIGLGVAFVVIQLREWSVKPFSMDSNSYGSLYYVITGFHLAHVIGGLLILTALLLWSMLDYFDKERHAPVSIGIIYWHFVDAVWLTVFFTFYVTPYLGG